MRKTKNMTDVKKQNKNAARKERPVGTLEEACVYLNT